MYEFILRQVNILEKTLVNLLTLKQYHQIISDKTERFYIDKDYRCYLFESEYDAKQFCEQIADIHFDDASFIKQDPFLSTCYGLGVETIRLKTSSEEQYTDIQIGRNDVRNQFYNPLAMKNILRLKQTKQRKYLANLSDVLFISPVIIDERKVGEYPVIHYSYAMLDSPFTYYVLFTTVQEFESWNKKQNWQYQPNQTSLQELNKVRDKNPVIINPTSDKLVLTHNQIQSITRAEQG